MTHFAHMLRIYRASRGVTVRVLAREIGTSPATITRVEQGKAVDMATYLKFLNWLGATP